MSDTHILIVDDDERIRKLLVQFVAQNGFLATGARDAAHAKNLMQGLAFDLIVMDVMMPGQDGFGLTRDLRADGHDLPIILLTAMGETSDKITGLECGADDYLTKPFEPKELLLRINAILRRVPQPEENVSKAAIRLGKLRFEPERGELWDESEMIRLTSTEILLLRIFAATPNAPVSRMDLIARLNEDGTNTQERAIDVQITRLRRKIETNPKTPRYLQTVRGLGYMLAPD